jgi:acyl carrier protein
LAGLKQYISDKILDGEDVGLDATTPLVAWGLLNSMEIARLVAFVRKRFDVAISPDKVTVEHFKDLDTLTRLVVSGG